MVRCPETQFCPIDFELAYVVSEPAVFKPRPGEYPSYRCPLNPMHNIHMGGKVSDVQTMTRPKPVCCIAAHPIVEFGSVRLQASTFSRILLTLSSSDGCIAPKNRPYKRYPTESCSLEEVSALSNLSRTSEGLFIA